MLKDMLLCFLFNLDKSLIFKEKDKVMILEEGLFLCFCVLCMRARFVKLMVFVTYGIICSEILSRFISY